ncbi:hypothetical protein Tco_0270152 [Tanacetum coccineum]
MVINSPCLTDKKELAIPGQTATGKEFSNPLMAETTHKKHVSTPSCDPPQSGEDRMKLTDFMDLCAQLQSRVLDLEKSKTTQAKEITSLKKRPLSLSFDFLFSSEIFKSLSFHLDHLYCLAILCLDQHANTLHHLESLLTISLDRLDIFEEDLVYQSLLRIVFCPIILGFQVLGILMFFICLCSLKLEHVVMNPTLAGIRHHHLHLYVNPEMKQLEIKRVDEYGFVIRLDLVRLTFGSVGPFYSIIYCTCDQVDSKNLLDRVSRSSVESSNTVRSFRLTLRLVIITGERLKAVQPR